MRDFLRTLALTCLLLCFVVAAADAEYASVLAEEPMHIAQASQGKTSAKPEASPAAPEKPAEKHSTPEDRKRLVAIAHKLEAAPLDPTLAPERQWAVSWVVAVPDIHVKICTNLLSDLRRPKYKYRSEIVDQLLISSAAYLIEHPDQADNYRAQNIGGMEGVIKAYSAIIKAEPQATAKSLDALLEKQREGKLADAVWEVTKSCQ